MKMLQKQRKQKPFVCGNVCTAFEEFLHEILRNIQKQGMYNNKVNNINM